MSIKDLVEELQVFQAEHGDLEVFVRDFKTEELRSLFMSVEQDLRYIALQPSPQCRCLACFEDQPYVEKFVKIWGADIPVADFRVSHLVEQLESIEVIHGDIEDYLWTGSTKWTLSRFDVVLSTTANDDPILVIERD